MLIPFLGGNPNEEDDDSDEDDDDSGYNFYGSKCYHYNYKGF